MIFNQPIGYRMLKTLTAAASLLLAAATSASAAPPAGYHLTFSDEFTSLSASDDQIATGSKWTNHLWYGGGNGPHDVPRPSNIWVNQATGKLVLTASRRDADTYWGGTLSSVNSDVQGFFQRYGYWEVRMKPAKGDNLLSSLYMISQTHMAHPASPPDPFEIDNIEYNSAGGSQNYAATTVHWYVNGVHYDNSPANKTNTGIDLSRAYHTYGMLWTASSIKFYFDGARIKSLATPADGHDPMAMMLVHYLTGGGATADTPLTAKTYFDYVRVYAPD